MKQTIRCTFQPDTDLEVEGPEYLDLLRQGVVVQHPTQQAEAPPAVDTPPVSHPAAGKRTIPERAA